MGMQKFVEMAVSLIFFGVERQVSLTLHSWWTCINMIQLSWWYPKVGTALWTTMEEHRSQTGEKVRLKFEGKAGPSNSFSLESFSFHKILEKIGATQFWREHVYTFDSKLEPWIVARRSMGNHTKLAWCRNTSLGGWTQCSPDRPDCLLFT